VLNDPVNFTDPTGEFLYIAGGIVGGAVGGAVIGTATGALLAIVNGGDVGSAALSGAINGAVMGGIGGGLAMVGLPYIPAASEEFGIGFLYGVWETKLPSFLSIFVNVLTHTDDTYSETPNPCP
jgi:hypothetical protein